MEQPWKLIDETRGPFFCGPFLGKSIVSLTSLSWPTFGNYPREYGILEKGTGVEREEDRLRDRWTKTGRMKKK